MAPRDTTFTDLDLAEIAGAEADVPLGMDEDAFRGFYDRTARQLWAYLYRLTGDRSAADDLLQDAYYRLLRANVSVESEAHRRHYLFRIATNLATDRQRRQRIRPAASGQDPERISTDSADTVLDRRLDLVSALACLSPRDRAMISLAYEQGASHGEIARIIGVRTGSIKPMLFRARRRLAELLGRGRTGGGR